MKLKGKVAIVTGAGRGLGRAIAIKYANEGARTVLVSRTGAELRETASQMQGSSHAFEADVSDEMQVGRLVERVVSELGTIDILVNNAGTIDPVGPAFSVTGAEWTHSIRVNLFGTFYCTQSVLPTLIAKKRGKIINIAGAGEGPLPNFSAYAASKSAIIRFTETLAEEIRTYNVDVNAMAPGGILTRMTERIYRAGELSGERELGRARAIMDSGGVPLDVPAELALFLASSDSDGLTGKIISAVHDDWKSFGNNRSLTESDMYTMRRVDSRMEKRLRLSRSEPSQ
jgi:NAD(P)-dependent dehydrogenase (short-subunit alcohol dehydrogenase family)